MPEPVQNDAIRSWRALYSRLDEARSLPSFDLESWLATLDTAGELPSSLARRLLAQGKVIKSADFLSSLPKFTEVPQAGTSRPTDTAAPGDEIGPYQLQRLLGAGGMGSVWLARRIDDASGDVLALKLAHTTMVGAVPAEVMGRERAILATLDHPHIVRLHGAGVTQAGRAYLALGYVDGEHIDQYCVSHRLGVPERLALVLQVARVLAHAHARRVIHRDVKPSNLLIDTNGRAHLVDFGIATFLDEASEEGTRQSTPTLTRHLGAALTPSYASPEQLRGEQPNVAADIYSLGIVLYELLTGRRPPCRSEPAPPSDVADSGTRELLRGALDAIVLKALKGCPAERYRSIDEFSQDLERCLAGCRSFHL